MGVPLPGAFGYRTVDTGEARIRCAVAGSGPPLLLLHGYPQTHLMWHRVAPSLAEQYTVVLADLRGYGDSDKPDPGPRSAGYSKRAMAADQVRLMGELGFDRFALAGHDRGGRVGHRLALDHPDAVTALAVLDIVPTSYAFRTADMDFGLAYYHWFFLAQSNGVPERLIGDDPGFWVRTRMNSASHGAAPFDPPVVDEYVRCFAKPAAIAASCGDYRAAAGIDLEHDDADAGAGHRLECPVLALWGEHGYVGRRYDVLDAWSGYAADLRGQPLPCDHYLPEEEPERTADALREFFADRS